MSDRNVITVCAAVIGFVFSVIWMLLIPSDGIDLDVRIVTWVTALLIGTAGAVVFVRYRQFR
jgi:hypothetical protein